MLTRNYNPDSYIQPAYTALPSAKADKPNDFSSALPIFLEQYPEFSGSRGKVEMLQYCFTFYINVDPEKRDLPILEKLAHAGKMAQNFFGLVTGGKK